MYGIGNVEAEIQAPLLFVYKLFCGRLIINEHWLALNSIKRQSRAIFLRNLKLNVVNNIYAEWIELWYTENV